MFLEHLHSFQLFKYLILSWDRLRYCSVGKHLNSQQHTLNSKRAFNLVEHKLKYSGCRSDVFSPQCPSGCSSSSPADLECLDSYFLAVCNPLAKVMGVQQICIYIYGEKKFVIKREQMDLVVMLIFVFNVKFPPGAPALP